MAGKSPGSVSAGVWRCSEDAGASGDSRISPCGRAVCWFLLEDVVALTESFPRVAADPGDSISSPTSARRGPCSCAIARWWQLGPARRNERRFAFALTDAFLLVYRTDFRFWGDARFSNCRRSVFECCSVACDLYSVCGDGVPCDLTVIRFVEDSRRFSGCRVVVGWGRCDDLRLKAPTRDCDSVPSVTHVTRTGIFFHFFSLLDSLAHSVPGVQNTPY